MKKITKIQLAEILKKHKLWLVDDDNGERADLSRANLSRADLSRANLFGANLSGADLSGANLSGADLSWANLSGADLSEANLFGANLFGANLFRANLFRANLSGADLSEANLSEANLSEADLFGAKNAPFIPYACPAVGSFIGYKKASGHIVELEILSEAQRLSAAGRKCRCDKAKVLSIQNLDGTISERKSVASNRDGNFIYTVGEIVEVKDFDTDRWNECSTGIHFFINRQEAVDY